MSDAGPFNYGWSVSAMRYRDLTTGQFVSKDDVLAIMQGRIDDSFATLKDMASAMFNGAGDVTDWENAVRVELKSLDTQMAALASGGWDNVSQQAWGEIGTRLQQEYLYLHDFAGEIADGNLSEAQILARLDMYSNDAWGAYADAERIAMENGGMTEEIRNLEGGAAHCDDCVAAAGQWAPIGTLPDIGDSQCGSNCQCTFDYR